MTVSLREVPLKDGEFSRIIIDIYYSAKQRERKTTKLKVYTKPTKLFQREHNTETRRLAEQIRAKTLLQIQEGHYGLSKNRRKYVDFIHYFEDLKNKREESGINFNHWDCTYKQLLKFAKETNRRPSFAQINQVWLEDFKVFLVKDLSPNTASSYFNILRKAIHEAERDKLIFDDPLRYVHSPKPIESQRDYLTEEELQKLAETDCKDELYKRAFLFSCLTGLRISDLIKLKWSEIKYSEALGWHIIYTQKKTKSNEVLQINEQARAFLGDAKRDDDFVFQGLTYSDRHNRMLKHWALDAGVRKSVTFHVARHTFATLQLLNGTDIYVLSKLLGHRKVSTTQIYGKIVDDTKKEAVNRMPKLNVTFKV